MGELAGAADPVYLMVNAYFEDYPFRQPEPTAEQLEQMQAREIPDFAGPKEALAVYEAIGRILGQVTQGEVEQRSSDRAAPLQASVKLTVLDRPKVNLRTLTVTHAQVDPSRAPNWLTTWRRWTVRQLAAADNPIFTADSNQYNPHPLEIEASKGYEQHEEVPLKAEVGRILDFMTLFDAK